MRSSTLVYGSITALVLSLAGCAPAAFTAAAGDLDVTVSILERGDSLIEPGLEMCMLGVQITNTSEEPQDPNSLAVPIFYSADGDNLDRQEGHMFAPNTPIEHESGAVFYPDVDFPLAPGALAKYIRVVECGQLTDGATVEFESESFPLSL